LLEENDNHFLILIANAQDTFKDEIHFVTKISLL